jgi:hypothetical protein
MADLDSANAAAESADDGNDDGDEPVVETTIEPAVEPAPINSADPFGNLDALRLSQSFVEMAGAKPLLLTVRCGSRTSRNTSESCPTRRTD